MPISSLVRKLKIKPGSRLAVINGPAGYSEELGALPAGAKAVDKLAGAFDWIQIFVENRAGLEKLLPKARKALKPESLLWIAFPKGSSKIQTDLTRDKGWDALKQSDLKWITLVSVNETWSAFSLRPYKPGEKKQDPR